METIAWTTISTAQSDPDPALIAIQGLRDVLARWAPDREGDDGEKPPVVYRDDVVPRLMDAFESLAVVASESMQHQTFAEILNALAQAAETLRRDGREQAAAAVETARGRLAESLGRLGSRATRAGRDSPGNRAS